MIDGERLVAEAGETIPDIKASGTTENYYPWFDWLRLALASTVLVFHEGLLKELPRAGDFAVQVFFALSGWLIGGILLTLSKQELPRFYFNRVLRIWCPYYLALSLLLAASLWHEHITRKWAEIVFYDVTFVYNIFGPRQLWNHAAQMPLHATGNHFWTVNAEEQFYLLAPLLLVAAPRRIGRSVAAWVVLALAAWATETYASIVFGVLAAVIAHAFGAVQVRGSIRAGAALLVALCAIAVGMGANYDLLAPPGAIGIVVLLAVKGRQHPWGEIAGGMSYPLYLNQWTSGFALNAIAQGRHLPFPRTLFTIPASLGLAAFLFWYFDRRILGSRQRLYSPRRGRIAMILAYAAVAIGVCAGLVRWSHA